MRTVQGLSLLFVLAAVLIRQAAATDALSLAQETKRELQHAQVMCGMRVGLSSDRV
jgi:hypothetical protein